MNCEDTNDRLVQMKNDSLTEIERRQFSAHLESCETCQHTVRAAAGLQILKDRENHTPVEGLFEMLMCNAVQTEVRASRGTGFWLGAGSALAAGVLLAVMSFWLITAPAPSPLEITTYQVSLDEPRDLNIAIDLKRDMPGATLRIVLSGGIELDGYGSRRELTWTADLAKGVNRLTLPIMAINDMGGQLLVQVEHDNRRKTLRVDLQVHT